MTKKIDFNKIIEGDAEVVLKTLAEKSVHCCVTSPPYWALRNYGHRNQIGQEETPRQFVDSLVKVFSEIHRVLRNDGTLWINIGDSYASPSANRSNAQVNGKSSTITGKNNQLASAVVINKIVGNLKAKDLVGIPWMVAFALREAGWYLRQDIIWSKPNPMPESVKDRCTKSYEYIFLFSKSKKYFFDADSIKTKSKKPQDNRGKRKKVKTIVTSEINGIRNSGTYEMANKRSVWTVPTESSLEDHFAMYPENLIVDCIKAGCPENGIVIDPFMGAGTTALVARKLNRNYLGIEINPKNIKIAQKRLAKELGLFP